MKILSPKSNFLGGALVSASHLGKMFKGNLYLLKPSEFLDNNNVVYHLYSDDTQEDDRSIWCNDICCDHGYDIMDEENNNLISILRHYSRLYLVNHQPINRCKDYLIHMLNKLDNGFREITILNYRACWNQEWDNELKVLYPDVKVFTLPYHYYLGDVDLTFDEDKRTGSYLMIGRSNSLCKVHKYKPIIEQYCEVDQVFPDKNISNVEFRKLLSTYKYVFTGYFYGGEGNPESCERYNHLEWSFMDALLSGCVPITSGLFTKELSRLGFGDIPVIPYGMETKSSMNPSSWIKCAIDNSVKCINSSPVHHGYIETLIKELEFGNQVIENIINNKR